MVAGIIGIVAALAPSVVKIVEALRPQPKSGAQKANDAFAIIVNALQAMGSQPGAPDWMKHIKDDEVKAAIETVVQMLKNQGELGGVTPATPAPPQADLSAMKVGGKYTIQIVGAAS